MIRKKGCVYVAGLAVAVGLAGTSLLPASDFAWTNTTGGAFADAGNWSPAGGPPGSADTAYFNAGGSARTTVTFPVGITVTAGLHLYRNKADNAYAFDISNGGVPARYEAGATELAMTYMDKSDLLLARGRLVSSTLKALGYDSTASLALDGPETHWQVVQRIDFYQTTIDLDIRNGATLEAQGIDGATGNHEIWNDNLDGNPDRVQVLRVRGTGSSLIATNLPAEFKWKGNSRLEVLDGAAATFDNVTFGNSSATHPHCHVLVSNATMRTKEFNFLKMQNKTVGHLDIKAGAVVETRGDAKLDGYDVTACTATVDNAAWTFTGALRVGWMGQTALIVTNGGSVVGTNVNMYFPGIAGNVFTNSVVVTGMGSVFITRSICPGGYSGTDKNAAGHLLVADNGRVEQVDPATGRLVIWAKGRIDLQDGRISNASPMQVKGILKGSGMIDGNVLVDGSGAVVEPGQSVGELRIGGTYAQSAGELRLDVGGTGPGARHDVLAVSGNVNLTGGKLVVNPAGRIPSGMVHYDVITSTATIAASGITVVFPMVEHVLWDASVVDTATGQALRLTSRMPQGTVMLVR